LVRCKHSTSFKSGLTTLPTAVIAADRASAAYDVEHTPEKKRQLERERERESLLESNKTGLQRAKDWAQENRYPLLFGFWVASMAGSWTMVNRNRYLSGAQKLVQARMYAQGATLAALMTSFAIEGNDVAKGQGRWETIRVLDPNDPEHKKTIEKKIHHESYPGEDQWRGMFDLIFSVLVVYIMRPWWGFFVKLLWVSHGMITLHNKIALKISNRVLTCSQK
jgi:hypothetical protein